MRQVRQEAPGEVAGGASGDVLDRQVLGLRRRDRLLRRWGLRLARRETQGDEGLMTPRLEQLEPRILLSQTVISGVPELLWTAGCSPTAAAMVVEYYDALGPTSSLVADETSASDVIWQLAEEMFTSATGRTFRSNVGPGMRSMCRIDYPETETNEAYDATFETVYTWDGTLTFESFCAEIDAGRPVHLGLSGDGSTHSVCAFGYFDNGGEDYGYVCHTTWSGWGEQYWRWDGEGVTRGYEPYAATYLEIDADTPGDANRDNLVDGADLAIWQTNYDPIGLTDAGWTTGDWTGDGKIDGADLALWQINYRTQPLGGDEMSEKGITFTQVNVPKVRDGSKTQTRRVMKPQPPKDIPDGVYLDAYDGGPQWNFWTRDGRVCNEMPMWKSRYQVGDMLYVRHAHWYHAAPDVANSGNEQIWDEITQCVRWPTGHSVKDCNPEPPNAFWRKHRSAAQMPKWAARTWAECVKVRVERVQDISEEDALAEGAERLALDDLGHSWRTYRRGFQSLWDATHGKGAWDRNDWVEVYDFKLAPDYIPEEMR